MIKFEKQGVEFVFRNFEWKEEIMSEFLTATYEIATAEGRITGAAEYKKNQNAFVFFTPVEINGQNVNGVIVPSEINMEEVIKKAKNELERKKEEKEQEFESKYSDKKQKINIRYNTSYGFELGEFEESKTGKKIMKSLKDQKVQCEVSKLLSKYKKDTDMEDYSITKHYEINIEELEKIVFEKYKEVIKAREVKEREIIKEEREIFKMAKETGVPQVLHKWAEDCNDPKEECSLDIICEIAMPDGSIEVKRSHTW